ncbi:MAG: 6,7-dimethyl-8-ribityllumazine synthase [Candidatus Sumerlaeia bacterium]|nr:6,7-dimethyl-8-ribityllumazine synthase [Candidatus Sumerlaeia bacterium]
MKQIEGHYDARGLKIDLIVSRFNDFISSHLLDGALDCLRRHGARDEDLTVYRVPGSFEIPYLAARLADRKPKPDAIICLGAVIRGATDHYQYVADGMTRGIQRVAMDSGVPVILGVLTTDTIEQAIERAGTKSGNKGADAALAAIEMATLFRQISAKT